MSTHSLSRGLAVLAIAAVVLPAQAQAGHEHRYFGFYTGPQPYTYPYTYPYAYYPPPAYAPPPRVRQIRPGVYGYEVSPGRWVRVRPGYGYQPPAQSEQQVRVRPQGPPPVPKRKPLGHEPRMAVQSIPEIAAPTEQPAVSPSVEQPAVSQSVGQISCDAAANIIRDFGFSDVRPTNCTGQVYDFAAARDGSAYSIKLSAADGELTEVRKR